MSISIRDHCDGWKTEAHYHLDAELITVGWGRLCPECRRAWLVDQEMRVVPVDGGGTLVLPDARQTEA